MSQQAHAPATPPPAVAPPPAATPAPGRPPRGGLRKWWARFLVLVMVAGAGIVFLLITSNRVTEAALIDLETVTLTAQSIPVETPRPGQVTAVNVDAQQVVEEGDRLGTIEVTTTDSDGEPVLQRINLVAPRNGIVIDEPVTLGSTLQPGQAFVEMYDPTQLTFVTDINLQDLPELGPGMVASLEAEGIDRDVEATIQRVVPRVTGTNGASDDVDPSALRLVLVPAGPEDVRGLVPGMRFTGTIDTRTGPSNGPKLVAMPAS